MKKYAVYSILFFSLLFCLFCKEAKESPQKEPQTQGVLLFHKFIKGQTYRILGQVEEDVFVNGRFDHTAKIINRIGVNIKDVTPQGQGLHSATFMTSETAYNSSMQQAGLWGETYESEFLKDAQGKYTIQNKYFMPTVRNVPVFPDYPIKQGDTWQQQGYEAHDMRLIFGIKDPFIVPFVATYKYYGTENQNIEGVDTVLHKITAEYNIKVPCPAPRDKNISDFPVSTTGFSKQTIYWNQQKGQIEYYYEDFKIVLDTFRGRKLEFQGKSNAKITEFTSQAPSSQIEKVKDIAKTLDIKDMQIKTSKEGLVLSIENINFLADSDVLQEAEKQKLQKIAKIISQFPENDILVAGHTALAGTKENRQKLSQARADAVANFLIKEGAKQKDKVFTKGYGAQVPIDTNDTKEGMQHNRRVEITILDK